MKLVRLLLVPFILILVLIIRWKKIRIGELWTSRLGHLVGNTECYLSEKDAGLHKSLDLWFPRQEIANKVIWNKYKKHLHVIPIWLGKMIVIVNKLFRGWEKNIVTTLQVDRDINNLWKKPHIGFTEEEEKKGKELLKSLGIPEGAKWVCLIVRDSAYLKDYGDFSYHDYRDANIKNYRRAAFELTTHGYYVIRMGSKVEKPFETGLNMVIDYANGKRTEFGDLYLGAKCAFCLGTSTGFMVIPQVFKRPCAVTDFVPVEYISTWCKDLVIWKHHIKDGKRMTFQEIIDSGAGQFMRSSDFKDAGITLENNTPEEISDLAMEMHHRSHKRDRHEQERFWDKFPRSSTGKVPLHGKIDSRIGEQFLKGYE